MFEGPVLGIALAAALLYMTLHPVVAGTKHIAHKAKSAITHILHPHRPTTK